MNATAFPLGSLFVTLGLAALAGRIRGIGVVTLRRDGLETSFKKGDRFPLRVLREGGRVFDEASPNRVETPTPADEDRVDVIKLTPSHLRLLEDRTITQPTKVALEARAAGGGIGRRGRNAEDLVGLLVGEDLDHAVEQARALGAAVDAEGEAAGGERRTGLPQLGLGPARRKQVLLRPDTAEVRHHRRHAPPSKPGKVLDFFPAI